MVSQLAERIVEEACLADSSVEQDAAVAIPRRTSSRDPPASRLRSLRLPNAGRAGLFCRTVISSAIAAFDYGAALKKPREPGSRISQG